MVLRQPLLQLSLICVLVVAVQAVKVVAVASTIPDATRQSALVNTEKIET